MVDYNIIEITHDVGQSLAIVSTKYVANEPFIIKDGFENIDDAENFLKGNELDITKEGELYLKTVDNFNEFKLPEGFNILYYNYFLEKSRFPNCRKLRWTSEKLSCLQLIGKGGEHSVYQDPDYPNFVLKIQRVQVAQPFGVLYLKFTDEADCDEFGYWKTLEYDSYPINLPIDYTGCLIDQDFYFPIFRQRKIEILNDFQRNLYQKFLDKTDLKNVYKNDYVLDTNINNLGLIKNDKCSDLIGIDLVLNSKNWCEKIKSFVDNNKLSQPTWNTSVPNLWYNVELEEKYRYLPYRLRKRKMIQKYNERN